MTSFERKYGKMTVGEAIEANRQQKMAEEIAEEFEDWESGLKDEDLLGLEYSKIARRLKTLYNIFLGALAILTASVVWAVIEEISK